MTRTERPAGVTLIALLNIATAILFGLALSPWDPLADLEVFSRVSSITTFDQTLIVRGWLAVAAVLHFLAGVGLFIMKPWAWRLTILLTGVGLAFYLVFDLVVHPVSVRLALYAGIAFYLNTRAVRDAFLRRRAPDEAHP
jgi:uncharacterized membrane protein (DUF2068 family)